MIKSCKKHGLTEYAKRGTRFRCRKCASESVSNFRKKAKLAMVERLGGKCCKCGYNRCIRALEFHHKDPSEKSFALSNGGVTRPLKEMEREADKCELVCSNCHREIEFGMQSC